jgi:hypothetical protein
VVVLVTVGVVVVVVAVVVAVVENDTQQRLQFNVQNIAAESNIIVLFKTVVYSCWLLQFGYILQLLCLLMNY